MKQNKIFIIIAACFLVMVSACTANQDMEEMNLIGIDLSNETPISMKDNHGGFHGDGISYTVYDFSEKNEKNIEDTIKNNSDWHPFPMTDNIKALVYGIEDNHNANGPYLVDNNGECIVPQIASGYYTFYDRHDEASNPHDDTKIFGRASFNITMAIYDSNTYKLYLLEMDT